MDIRNSLDHEYFSIRNSKLCYRLISNPLFKDFLYKMEFTEDVIKLFTDVNSLNFNKVSKIPSSVKTVNSF